MSDRTHHLIRLIRWIAGAVGLITLPFVVFTVFLRWSRLNLTGSGGALLDLGGILLAVLSGVGCIWLLPLAWQPRVVASAGYSLLMAAVLTLYGFFYVCNALGRCL